MAGRRGVAVEVVGGEAGGCPRFIYGCQVLFLVQFSAVLFDLAAKLDTDSELRTPPGPVITVFLVREQPRFCVFRIPRGATCLRAWLPILEVKLGSKMGGGNIWGAAAGAELSNQATPIRSTARRGLLVYLSLGDGWEISRLDEKGETTEITLLVHDMLGISI